MALLWSSTLLLINHRLASGAYYDCYSARNLTHNIEYINNLNGFLWSMSTDVKSHNGFSYTRSVTYTTTTLILHCIGLCRADLISSDSCSICISNATNTLINNCPNHVEVISWGQDTGCVVRCAPHDFPQQYESQPTIHSCNSTKVSSTYLPQFDHVLANLTYSVSQTTAENGLKYSFPSEGGDSPKYFATQESELDQLNLTIYALGFCLPTLNKDSCVTCLQAAANHSKENCRGKKGASIFMPSCVLRYEVYCFYKSSSLVLSPPISSSSSPPSQAPNDLDKDSKFKKTIVVAIVVLITFLLTIIGFIIKYVLRRRKRNKEEEAKDDEVDAIGMESTETCIQFNVNTLRVATNDFSIDNKLGQGGFGVVYKGRLPNGHQIAVKRLVVPSTSREGEFANEVQLVAKLHHKNLIKLLGFCLRQQERFLVYELALNGSLDRFLFDPIRREHLTWEIRYNIIKGIARGMNYLHEQSQPRIIHRDLKAGNVLLDESFTPKISDFGTARLFVEDQSRASKIVGTYGYMAPEYVKYGKISVKIDVFSFGVLMLEIVSGRKNSASENPKHIEHLLSKVWIYWKEGKLTKLVDPTLVRVKGDNEEIMRCIHIGLLCVQNIAEDRPCSNSVNLMLEAKSQGCSERIPPPLKPAYFMHVDHTGDLNDETSSMVQHGSMTYDSHQTSLTFRSTGISSANEASITHTYPQPR